MPAGSELPGGQLDTSFRASELPQVFMDEQQLHATSALKLPFAALKKSIALRRTSGITTLNDPPLLNPMLCRAAIVSRR